jgi:regulator of replication initiation timing
MPRVYSTCRRRGYELVDVDVWEVTEDREHIGFVYTNTKPYTPCDPPRYIQTDPDEHERILPRGATVIEQRFTRVTKTTGNIVEQVAALVEENERLKAQVAELQKQPKGPDVELFDRWRLEYRWRGSADQLVQEWGFHSSKSAMDRMERIQEYFKDFEFNDIATVHYKINEE